MELLSVVAQLVLYTEAWNLSCALPSLRGLGGPEGRGAFSNHSLYLTRCWQRSTFFLPCWGRCSSGSPGPYHLWDKSLLQLTSPFSCLSLTSLVHLAFIRPHLQYCQCLPGGWLGSLCICAPSAVTAPPTLYVAILIFLDSASELSLNHH